MRLLVAEDDVKLARVLERGLVREGYEVDLARTGDEALSRASAREYDAVVLDVMLPGMDGFTVCRALRHAGLGLRVLMLTARDEVQARIDGLQAGADDYLVKPFHFGELLARLQALFRRGPFQPRPPLEVGGLCIDSALRVATLGGRRIELTAREFGVLEMLARHANEVVSRAQLLEQVWHEDFEGSPNVVDVYVSYLRKKLERSSGRRLIRTVRGVGFVLESP
jgi:two-component system OmpR family response regulator